MGKALPLDVTGVRSSADLTPLQGLFELYATGYRNPYDIVWHHNGRLYLNGNASNVSQGNTPGSTDGCSTPSISPGDQPDTLNIVTQGAYGGHPIRAPRVRLGRRDDLFAAPDTAAELCRANPLVRQWQQQ